jgi:hypothetical protein
VKAIVLLAVVALAGGGAASPPGNGIRGTVWAPECGIEPGVCTFVRTRDAVVEGCLVGARACVRARSGRDGGYYLHVPRPGRYRLVARKDAELGEYRTQPRVVVVRPGRFLRGADLGMSPPDVQRG